MRSLRFLFAIATALSLASPARAQTCPQSARVIAFADSIKANAPNAPPITAAANAVITAAPGLCPPPPPPPTVNFSATCTGLTCQMQAIGGPANATAYTWDWGNGQTVTKSTASTANTWASAGTYMIVLAVTGPSGTAKASSAITVSAPPPPPPPPAPPPPPSVKWNPNEPAGMTPLVERGFNARVENGWGDIGGSNFSIVVDSTAPRSPSSVGQALYDPMIACGVGPINTWSPKFTNPRTLYVSFWLKMDPAWYGNISTVNKVLFISIGNGGRVFVPVIGSGTGPLSIQVRLQGMGVHVPAISWNAYANVPGANTTITRGQWAHVEVLLVANTPGQLDGQVDYWLNGGHVAHYANVGYSAASETGAMNVWQGVKWNPTYGGGCNGPSANGKPLAPQFPVAQWQRMDHLYVSGKP